MKLNLLIGLVAAIALVGCDSHQKQVQDAEKDLATTQQEAAKDVTQTQNEAMKDVNAAKTDASKDVADAQGKAVKDINATKEDAAKDIRSAQKKLSDEKAAAASSASSMSTSTDNVSVTPEQCARFASNATVRPEDKALYEACSKLDKKSFR